MLCNDSPIYGFVKTTQRLKWGRKVGHKSTTSRNEESQKQFILRKKIESERKQKDWNNIISAKNYRSVQF